MDINNLRKLAQEPERTAMARTQQFPSMGVQLSAQRAEISALRRGLLEAIFEIDGLRRFAAGERLKLAFEAAVQGSNIIPIQGTDLTPDVVVGVPVQLWEDLIVAIDYMPEAME